MSAPKPAPRPDRVSLWQYFKLFRRDILSAQPERLYRAKMAEFKTPFFRSFLINQPSLVRRVLVQEAHAFPKSGRVSAGLAPLLGQSVFVTNGEQWRRQRRIIDPAFSGGRVKALFPDILKAANAASDRTGTGQFDVESAMSRVAADVIFRAMFSKDIDDELAARTYEAFRIYQRRQPVLTPAAFVPILPALVGRPARRAATDIRDSLAKLIEARRVLVEAGTAPDDLATNLMTRTDPKSGTSFSDAELLDQIAIFFLAGHETSAATLGWALWLLAAYPEAGEKVRAEARAFVADPTFANLSLMPFTRDVVRETLRLYPPVPMLVREATQAEDFRGREVKRGNQVVVSPWHLHRHEDLWDDPDAFKPERWQLPDVPKEAFLPFSAGPRICPGAGFAMTEAVVILAVLMASHRFEVIGPPPVPVAHLTVRSKDGITLDAQPV